MALKTSLNLIARRIAQAVLRFAAAEGWPREDFALAGTYDENTERISLTFGTDHHFEEKACYSGIFRELRREFNDHPELIMHIGLIVRQVTSIDEIIWDGDTGGDVVDLTDLLDRYLSEKRP